MQVSLENTANLERRMTVNVPATRLNEVVESRLQEIARTSNMKGFRKGKVPTKVIEQRFGPQVRAEAYGDLVRMTFGEAVREKNLLPAGTPSIEAGKNGEDGEITFSATFEVVPDFGTIDVSKLEVVRESAEVVEADIENMIETLRQQRRGWMPVEDAAEAGYLVNVDTYAQTDEVRLPAEGTEKGATVIGSGVMFPEIESQLIGMKAGDERTIEVAFPADWRVAELAGKAAKVHVTASKVSQPVLPDVDEAFIKSFGIRGGKLDQFHKEVRNNLERELKGNLMFRLRAEVATKLIAAYAHVELPPRLVAAEAQSIARNAEQQARQQGQQINANPEQFMSAAHNRVAAALLVGEIARQNDLKLDPARLKETMQLIASTYEDPSQVIELYRNDPNMMSQLQNRVMEEQVIDWIAERAQSTEVSLSFADAMRPAA
ncbi:MAG: trigger factor [Arenimonas sp.]